MRDHGLDAVKGLFVLLVILGHIPLTQQAFYEPFLWLYRFHVAIFFMLVFMHPAKPFAWRKFGDQVIRYGVPFGVFYTLYSVLWAVMQGGESLSARLVTYAYGFLAASSRTLDAACGLKMMWFLPALLMLLLCRSLLARVPQRYLPPIYVVLFGLHALVGALPAWRYDIPWGMAVVSFILPLGLVLPALLALVRQRVVWRWGVVVAALVAHGLSIYWVLRIDVGDLRLFSVMTPLQMLVQDAVILTTTLLVLMWRQWLAQVPALAAMGMISLQLYLIHPIFLQATKMAFAKLPALPVGVALPLSLAVVAGSSFVAVRIFQRLGWAYALVFPRDVASWAQALARPFRR